MKIELGHDDYLLSKNQTSPVCCDFDALVNAHMLIMGKTGMGKTTFLRCAINQMVQNTHTPRIHIMDVHGDIELTGGFIGAVFRVHRIRVKSICSQFRPSFWRCQETRAGFHCHHQRLPANWIKAGSGDASPDYRSIRSQWLL